MFGLGAPELILILVIVLIIFGAGRLPQVMGSFGKGIKEFRDAAENKDETTTTTSTTTTTAPPAPPAAATPVDTGTGTNTEIKS